MLAAPCLSGQRQGALSDSQQDSHCLAGQAARKEFALLCWEGFEKLIFHREPETNFSF